MAYCTFCYFQKSPVGQLGQVKNYGQIPMGNAAMATVRIRPYISLLFLVSCTNITIIQCSSEVLAAGVFTGYSRFKHRLHLQAASCWTERFGFCLSLQTWFAFSFIINNNLIRNSRKCYSITPHWSSALDTWNRQETRRFTRQQERMLTRLYYRYQSWIFVQLYLLHPTSYIQATIFFKKEGSLN